MVGQRRPASTGPAARAATGLGASTPTTPLSEHLDAWLSEQQPHAEVGHRPDGAPPSLAAVRVDPADLRSSDRLM